MSEHSRATADLMDKLHGMTAQAMINLISDYESGKILDKDGNPEPLPAAVLSSISKFLKDNGVDRPATAFEAVDKLKGTLPKLAPVDPSEFDNVTAFRR